MIGLNLLSVGAAFGVLVAVFQHHWAQSLLGFQSDGAVVDWLPLFAFVVLFGLSMDYTVLVLERAREARRPGASAETAAAEALGATGGTVTSAALVMIAVFSVFATLPLLEFKQLGVGLAAAIALDATIVRGSRCRRRSRCWATAAWPRLGPACPADALRAGIMKSMSPRSDRAMSKSNGNEIDLRSVRCGGRRSRRPS